VKLEAYRRYLPVYLRILASSSNRVFVNDLFAGSGQVRDGSGVTDGSPLIACRAAAQVAQQLASRGRHVVFSLRFVELNADVHRQLDELTQPFRDQLDIKVLKGSASGHLDQVLADSAGAPSLTFLDPDGIKVTFEQVAAFARPYGEMILNFDVQGLLRTAALPSSTSVTDFCGGTWWQRFARNGAFDEVGFLREYATRLNSAHRYNRVGWQRVSFPAVHANRAFVQGAYADAGIRKWQDAVRRSLPADATITLDFVPELDRRAQVDTVITAARTLSGRQCYYGAILAAIDGERLPDPAIHQALYFLREHGHLRWTSALGRNAHPAPRFTFDEVPYGLRWDEIERSERAADRVKMSV
jgi:three-Cys-motif partner protein